MRPSGDRGVPCAQTDFRCPRSSNMSKLASQLPAWKELEQLQKTKKINLKDAFASDKDRYERFSRSFATDNKDVTMLLDFSKNLIDDEVFAKLLELAKQADVDGQKKAMFEGKHINVTEDRAVLHVALRDLAGDFKVDEPGVADVKSELQHMREFTDAVRNKTWKGYTGKPIKTVINIGIGGSDLGPVMVTEALKYYSQRDLDLHFVSNIDGTHMAEALRASDPETTLVIIASKTFTTIETITNAETARDWFLDAAKDKAHVAKHFVALSTNEKAVTEFGIAKENMFKFWDWVGGRYSLWSAIGLSIMVSIGWENFKEMLDGAHAMDLHYLNTPLEKNLPAILGLLGIWYDDFFNAQTHAILPYDQYMHKFADYFQQGDMESNGKSITKNGDLVDYQTGPVIWGQAGTNGQHAFYQLIHQGTQLIPADFIAFVNTPNPTKDSDQDVHELFLGNYFAQTKALAFGKTADEVRAEGTPEEIVPARVFTGNRPTTSIFGVALTPFAVGELIALYEHITFVEGTVWGLDSYDQWGVELGKQLAKQITPAISQDDDALAAQDASTQSLIKFYRANREF